MKKVIISFVVVFLSLTVKAQEGVSNIRIQLPDFSTGNLITYNRKVYLNGIKLSQDEVRNTMIGSDLPLYLYNKGIKKNRNGNIWSWSGISVSAIGLVLGAINDFDDSSVSNFGSVLCIAGIVATLPGTIVGIVLKEDSKKLIEQSVEMYNNSINKSTGIELKFGISGNGIGMVLNF